MSPLHRIVSGGQTGADRAALDAAQAAGVEVGGWCPAGRWAEDGPIPAVYPLRETVSPNPAERTRLNVRDSDATLILTVGPTVGGTALTLEMAKTLGRPHQLVDLSAVPDSDRVADWIRQLEGHVLNVAGPRESESPGVYARSLALMTHVLRLLTP